MFDDIRDTVDTYLRLKSELYKVETFLKHSLSTRLKNTKPDAIVDTIIDLIGKQESPEMTKHNQAMVKCNIIEQIEGRL